LKSADYFCLRATAAAARFFFAAAGLAAFFTPA